MILRFLLIAWLALGCAGLTLAQDAPTHTVRPGETLYQIARTNGMSVPELKRLNGLSDDVIRVGQVLRLAEKSERDAAIAPPTDPRADTPPDENSAGGSTAGAAEDDLAAVTERGVTTHVAKQGETFYSIAVERGTKAYILFALNDGLRGPLEPGTPVVVPASAGTGTYRVKSGDTLGKIANAHGTTIAALRRTNALSSDIIRIGQSLAIPGAAGGDIPMQGGTPTYAVGSVTVFPETNSGRIMAGGGAFEPDEFVVAHRELPFDTLLIVENAETGRASFARVADRGPLDDSRVMEISPALAAEIGVQSGGQVRVRLVE